MKCRTCAGPLNSFGECTKCDTDYFYKKHIYYCRRGNHVLKCKYHRSGSSYRGGSFYTCPTHFGELVQGILNKSDVPNNAKWEIEADLPEAMTKK